MIPIFKPSMGQDEINAVSSVFESGWIGTGPKVLEFEKYFAKFIGTEFAVGLDSCTSALNLSLLISGIRNCEVITTPLTFASTAHSILYNNATPIFADIQKDTLNIDPNDIRKKITNKTKAIIPVHYAGHPCDMDEIMEIADEFDLLVVEDCAHACGSKYKKKCAGSIGNTGCFSFQAVKNLATGDGGMITTNEKNIYDSLLTFRWMGINKNSYQRETTGRYQWHYSVESIGLKAAMNDITAAIGIVQLNKLEKMNKRRKEIIRQYNEAFSLLEWVDIPIQKGYVSVEPHIYALKIKNGHRNDLIEYLSKKGISSGVHYIPLFLHPVYKKLGTNENCPVTDNVWKELISLPLFPDMTDEEVSLVIENVKYFGK